MKSKKKEMIDYNALFTISYGLYIVSSGNKQQGNGYISNTVFQVTAEPAQFATCCNKDNYTCDLIMQNQAFAVSVLQQNASSDLIGTFGYQSGKVKNKLENVKLQYGQTTNVPIVLDDAIAFMEFKVVNTIDLGTHLMFIAELLEAKTIDEDKEPLTYAYYRRVKKGFSPKNAPTYIEKSKLEDKDSKNKAKKYKCEVCGYIHDDSEQDVVFEDLDDDYGCPICGAEKEDFYLI